MAMQDTGGKFALPGLDQEQGNRAGGMNGKAAYPGIDTGVAPLAAVGVSGMAAQGSDAFDNRGKPAKGGPNIASYQRVEGRTEDTDQGKGSGERHGLQSSAKAPDWRLAPQSDYRPPRPSSS